MPRKARSYRNPSHNSPAGPRSASAGLWSRLAALLNKYSIKAATEGVGASNRPHCAAGLGRAGAKLNIQLQNRETKFVMWVELKPDVADSLRPHLGGLEQATSESFTLIPNSNRRELFQIKLTPVTLHKQASFEDQERAILNFAHRVDKVRNAFRDQLKSLPRPIDSEPVAQTLLDGDPHSDPHSDTGDASE